MNSRWMHWFVLIIAWVLMETWLAPSVANDESGNSMLPAPTVEKLFGTPGKINTSGNQPVRPKREIKNTQSIDGEDVGVQGEDTELLVIRQQMQYHLQLMRQHSNGESTEDLAPLQFEILQRLDSLTQRDQQAVVSTVVALPSEGQAGQEAGVGRAGEKLDSGASDPAAREGTPIEQNWNQLPPTVQIPLRESSAKPFLPGYEQLLQQFYKNLKRN